MMVLVARGLGGSTGLGGNWRTWEGCQPLQAACPASRLSAAMGALGVLGNAAGRPTLGLKGVAIGGEEAVMDAVSWRPSLPTHRAGPFHISWLTGGRQVLVLESSAAPQPTAAFPARPGPQSHVHSWPNRDNNPTLTPTRLIIRALPAPAPRRPPPRELAGSVRTRTRTPAGASSCPGLPPPRRVSGAFGTSVEGRAGCSDAVGGWMGQGRARQGWPRRPRPVHAPQHLRSFVFCSAAEW